MMRDSTPRYVDARELKAWIHDEAELALLDVREHGQFGENHLFFAVPLPYSELELHIARLVPRVGTRTVIYGDADTGPAVQAAAHALEGLGYSQVHVLRGGIQAWRDAGYATFAGVNLPSKTFGEIAEHVYHTPSVSARKLHDMLNDAAEDIVVLDGRPVAEYRKMNIPGAICCPNGELALRIGELVPDPRTKVIINCAGRTRSIIGAQTLINLGIPNEVYALENGTQGWYLADLPLEHQSSRVYPEQVAAQGLDSLRQRSRRLREKFAVPIVDAAQLRAWLDDEACNVFLCDVRTEEEYCQDGLPAQVQHTPGGQLIQATDQYIGVRKARIVLCDTDGIRAPVVASWLKQLGWNVSLLENPRQLGDLPARPVDAPVLSHTQYLAAGQLTAFVAAHPDAAILDARPSAQFRKGSLQGARWTIRPTLMQQLANRPVGPVLLLGDSREKLALLAGDLEQAGYRDIHLCVVDDAALQASALPMAAAPALPDEACIDYLFFVHDRHDGNKAAARKYLEWETNLVAQIDEQERKTFSVGG
ncbi:rhodanese-like domain-containing protein [Bordetella sp. BOR01]|uniref:rhodanese-like domain-containing protein n=1 Tax=Bordetella sp. BOR01 TaxID=2854779 RepID=UPI001C469D18|nr:rhodanese-like domain-containing protein [Bordetella sp. BOR01]MBV7483405.1 sulfurtransferase [Bordetella sp. BOR01]